MTDRRPTTRFWPLVAVLALAPTLSAGCTKDDPEETDLDTGFPDFGTADTGRTDAADVATDADAIPDADADPDADDTTADAPGDAADGADGADAVGPPGCPAAASDYSPGDDDEWPACISDDDEYHQFEDSISTIGRVAGFERIADLLWRIDGTPTVASFISARDTYATGEGLDSRVQRREDEHYPAVTDPDTGDALRCRDEGVPEIDPDRCVGPAQILPILNDAFQRGTVGDQSQVQAARVEAALVWFLYVSSHKEAVTCTTAKKDCDSSYAYYTGGIDRRGGLGLAGYVSEIAPETHDRIWDGILAVRCWRDLDGGAEAADLEMRDRAVAQLDAALLHGVAQVVADRLATLAEAEGATFDGAWAFVEILGPVLGREANVRNPDAADALAAQWAAGVNDIDIDATLALLEEIFPCP